MTAATSININQEKVQQTSILIVDSYPLMRQALRMGIEQQHDFKVIADACDEKETIDLVSRLHPEIVVISKDLLDSNGLDCAKKIKKGFADIKVLILTPAKSRVNVLEMVESGASGYASKKEPIEGIIHALRTLVADDSQFYRPLSDYSSSESTLGNTAPLQRNKSDKLSGKELTILRYLAAGMSNKDIALRLGLSLPSVKVRISNIFMKIHASSRIEAVSMGLRRGILTLNDLEA